MKTAFIIGNGTSRASINLENLRGLGTIIGCNALYRRFKPDILFISDNSMAAEVRDSGYKGTVIIPETRDNFSLSSVKIRPIETNSSGGSAIYYTGCMQYDTAFLIGFDCYGGNIYEGTKNYNGNPSSYGNIVDSYYYNMKGFDTTFINVIKDGKDGISKVLKSLDNYAGAMDMEEFNKYIQALKKLT